MNDRAPRISWLWVAVAVAAIGAAVTLALGAFDPPEAPTPPRIVQHEPADVGNWEPFPQGYSESGKQTSALDAGADELPTNRDLR